MENLELWQIGVGILGGLVAGVINTLAGNGSTITLSILTEIMGLPGNIANATNRIGVFLQTSSSTLAFKQGGVIDWSEQKRPILITLLGAAVGIFLALQVDNKTFMSIFKILMILMFVSVLVKPSRWIDPKASGKPWPKPLLWTLLFILGLYGGFIQMGMGIFFLALAVLGAKYTLLEANVMKMIIITIYTLPALLIFAYQGRVEWIYGLTIALGQVIGGYFTARFAVKFPKINTWAYYILLASVLLAILSLFDVV